MIYTHNILRVGRHKSVDGSDLFVFIATTTWIDVAKQKIQRVARSGTYFEQEIVVYTCVCVVSKFAYSSVEFVTRCLSIIKKKIYIFKACFIYWIRITIKRYIFNQSKTYRNQINIIRQKIGFVCIAIYNTTVIKYINCRLEPEKEKCTNTH